MVYIRPEKFPNCEELNETKTKQNKEKITKQKKNNKKNNNNNLNEFRDFNGLSIRQVFFMSRGKGIAFIVGSYLYFCFCFLRVIF